MALEVWYKSDIENALRAAELANSAALDAANKSDDPYVTGYWAGYRSALTTLALAFGLPVVSSVLDRRKGTAQQEIESPVARFGLLDSAAREPASGRRTTIHSRPNGRAAADGM